MKKLIAFLSGALLLSACSDNNYPGPEQNEGVARSFLTVSLVTPKSATRADDYENGTDSENEVNNVRFYFFYDGGTPALVFKQAASNSYLSYIDWTPESGDFGSGDDSQTVEKIVTATLGINMPANNNGFPDLVLAVINPTADVLAIPGNPSLETLLSTVGDYYTDLHDNNFVITNSVYADGNPIATVNATPIDENCFQPTIDETKGNELIIYVERVLARLDFTIGMTNGQIIPGTDVTIYPVGTQIINSWDEDLENTSSQEETIYVQFLGWNITQTPSASYLVKNINPRWPSDLFKNLELWNSDNYSRSFWAINPPADKFEYIYGSWNKPTNGDGGNYATALPIPSDEAVTAYMQENAAPNDDTTLPPTNPTEVIIGAQLVDASGNPLTLVRWANRYYTQEGAKNAIANVLELYSLSGNTYTKIKPSQLEFVTAKDIYGETLPDDVADYYAYVQLTDAARSLTWYNGNGITSSATPYESITAVNNYIIDRINYLMVWNSGQTYYYFEIQHLGANDSPGYFGVVRNHLYKCSLTSIEGLGTPVYSPEQTITPEKPGGDQSVLTVQIDILQWRVVNQKYELTWP